MAIAEKELTVKANRAGLEGAMATTPEGKQVAVPSDILAKAQDVIDSYTASLTERANDYIERASQAALARRRGQGIGAVTVGPYVGFDLIVFSPIQFIATPPYLPHKVVAGGELTLLLAYMWTNPVVSIPDGFAVSSSVQLGSHPYRVRFEQVDLTNVVNGPDHTITNTFGAPAAMLTALPWFFIAPNPGVNPRLMEVNVTADITFPVKPWAAFATNHFDVDEDPAFLGIPGASAGWRNGQPLRYLVYPD